MASGTFFFIFFLGTVMCGLTFGRCSNSNLIMPFLPEFYYRKRAVWVPQSKVARPKISKWIFFGYLTKNVAHKFFCFGLANFGPEKPHVNPKKTLFLRWDKLGSLDPHRHVKSAATSQKKFNAALFLTCWNNNISKFSVEPRNADQ